jgi:hypothetical protein
VALLQQAKAGHGQQIGRVEIDLQCLEPEFVIVISERHQGAEVCRVVHQSVQVPEFLFDRVGQRGIVIRCCTFQIQWIQGGFGVTCGCNFIVGLLQSAHITIQQDDAGAMRGTGTGDGAADAVGGAGDQDYPLVQQSGCGAPVSQGIGYRFHAAELYPG